MKDRTKFISLNGIPSINDGDFLLMLQESASQTFFLAFHCHNTEQLHVPLSLYRKCTRILVAANINAYFQILVVRDVRPVGR
jgi:hypothetical protein